MTRTSTCVAPPSSAAGGRGQWDLARVRGLGDTRALRTRCHGTLCGVAFAFRLYRTMKVCHGQPRCPRTRDGGDSRRARPSTLRELTLKPFVKLWLERAEADDEGCDTPPISVENCLSATLRMISTPRLFSPPLFLSPFPSFLQYMLSVSLYISLFLSLALSASRNSQTPRCLFLPVVASCNRAHGGPSIMHARERAGSL